MSGGGSNGTEPNLFPSGPPSGASSTGTEALLNLTLNSLNYVMGTIYPPIFKNVTKAPERVMPPPDIEPNRVQLSSEIPKVSPEIIKGLQVTHSTPIAERVSRTNTWKLCGQGNPMMGMPSNSLETQIQWQGGAMTNKGPEWQAVFGPISVTELIKGKFKLASQIVKVGDNGMHVFVNDWDINNWNMFMYVGNWHPKIKGHHFKVKNTVQVQGGLMNLFSGQSALQHEFGYNLGRFKGLETTVGLSTGTQIPPFRDAWKVPMALLDADPYLTFKGHNTIYQEDKSFDCDNLFSLSWQRQRQTVSMKMTSTPTEFHSEQLMAMSTKNSLICMKNIPKSDRVNYFDSWVESEKSQYSVEGNFDIKSKKFDYSIGFSTKYIGRKSEVTAEIKAPPGELLPSKYSVSVSENMVAGAEAGVTPLTTTISLIYDAKKPESPPEIGLGFNIEL